MTALSEAQKVQLIHQHPCFSLLTSNEVRELAALCTIENCTSGTTLVKESELVDCIYFIAEGVAEVQIKSHSTKTPIAILNPGEVIGLNETGFYSTTGQRTASIVALSNMVLVRLNLSALQQFAVTHPHLNAVMRDNTDILNRMTLIKKGLPFAKLSIENLNWLAKQVSTLFFSANQIIFNKDDTGDQCYLIVTGKVEIFIPNDDGTKNQIAILEPAAVFGEAALLMDLPRNASARALENCELLSIHRDTLYSILKKEKNVAQALMLLMKNRSRPRALSYIEAHRMKTDDQETIIILKDPKNWQYYQLTEQEWFIWQLLDGQHSLHDITLAFHKQYQIFNPGMIATLIRDLEEADFIEKSTPHFHLDPDATKGNKWVKHILLLRQIMEISISFGSVDAWITKSYRKGVFLFYTYPAQIIMALITIIGFIFFLNQFHYHISLLKQMHHLGWLLVLALISLMGGTILHELAHAYTTKAFGRGVAAFGVGWFWTGPVAFCDTSDMWLCGRWQRLAVDFAGVHVDLILAGLASLFALFVTQPFIAIFLWLFALIQYMYVFFNLSPIIELDGYYILMDLTNKDNLRQSAIMWLMDDLKKTLKNPSLFWQYRAEVTYWVVCIIFLIFEIIIPYWITKYLLLGLFGSKNPYISFLIPLLVVFFSSLTIWAELKQKKTRLSLMDENG